MKIDIIIPDVPVSSDRDRAITGLIFVKPKEPQYYSSIKYELIQEVRGRMVPHREVLFSKTILKDQVLKAHEEYEFPIEFNPFQGGATYDGKNANIEIKVEVTATPEDMKDEAEWKALFLKSGKPFKHSESIYIPLTKGDCQISNDSIISDVYPKVFHPIFFTPFLSLLFYFFTPQLNKELIYIIPIALSIALVLKYLVSSLFGKITINIVNTEGNQFEVHISPSKGWEQFREIKSKLRVSEKVIDRRGTSNSSSNYPIYESKEQVITHLQGTVKVTFEIPEMNLPLPMKVGDLYILWHQTTRIQTSFGIPVFVLLKLKVTKNTRTNDFI